MIVKPFGTAIAEAGEEFGICPLGLNALDMLRIEAGLIFAGYEFCDQTDPFEAGIAFTVPLKTKEEDFSGKESLILRKNSPQRVLVGLELTSNEVALHGDGVYIGKATNWNSNKCNTLSNIKKEYCTL